MHARRRVGLLALAIQVFTRIIVGADSGPTGWFRSFWRITRPNEYGHRFKASPSHCQPLQGGLEEHGRRRSRSVLSGVQSECLQPDGDDRTRGATRRHRAGRAPLRALPSTARRHGAHLRLSGRRKAFVPPGGSSRRSSRGRRRCWGHGVVRVQPPSRSNRYEWGNRSWAARRSTATGTPEPGSPTNRNTPRGSSWVPSRSRPTSP